MSDWTNITFWFRGRGRFKHQLGQSLGHVVRPSTLLGIRLLWIRPEPQSMYKWINYLLGKGGYVFSNVSLSVCL